MNDKPRQMTLQEVEALNDLQCALNDEAMRIGELLAAPNRQLTQTQADYYLRFHKTLFGTLENYGIYAVKIEGVENQVLTINDNI